jgi:MOSC domain-containing protein YiiM
MQVLSKLEVLIEHIFISSKHNFIGHHGKPPGTSPSMEMVEVRCIEGRGILGDRYFDHKDHYKGQITFFEMEVYERICAALAIRHLPPSTFRRNVLTRGIDLNAWIGREFVIQGVTFEGTEECKPCYWMNQCFGSGAEVAMKNHGGLRARILSDGILRKGQ